MEGGRGGREGGREGGVRTERKAVVYWLTLSSVQRSRSWLSRHLHVVHGCMHVMRGCVHVMRGCVHVMCGCACDVWVCM